MADNTTAHPNAGTTRPLYTPRRAFTLRIANGRRSRPAEAALRHRLVEPLVVERAKHGRELAAEFAGVLLHLVQIEGAAIGPGLDHGEVVRPAGLPPHVE